jgi:hypothetical protein
LGEAGNFRYTIPRKVSDSFDCNKVGVAENGELSIVRAMASSNY